MTVIIAHWIPILVSTLGVWLVSSLVWMVLPYHRSDYAKIPDEDSVQGALRAQDLAPGLYSVPHCRTHDEMNSEEIQAKIKQGPSAFITIIPADAFNMAKSLSIWFAQNLLFAVIAAHLLHAMLADPPSGAAVFHVTALVYLVAHGGAYLTDAVWFSRPWKVVFKQIFDALLYALTAAAVFAWLW